jgi:hypothetical protein
MIAIVGESDGQSQYKKLFVDTLLPKKYERAWAFRNFIQCVHFNQTLLTGR